jgi:hypothetical protein
VVVIINPPPVSKLYRICIESDDGDEQFLIQLAHGQDDEATIVLEWARNEDALQNREDNGAFFSATVERSSAQKFEYYAPGHAAHWHILLSEESGGYPDAGDIEVRIVYVPSKGMWYPLLYKRDEEGEPEKITMFSVAEVSRAAVLFEVTTA